MSAVGYRVVLPSGWHTLHLRRDLEGQVKRLVEESARNLPASIPPDQRIPHLRKAERMLMSQLSRARDEGVVDYYLPSSPMDATPVMANLVVSLTEPPVDGHLESSDVGRAMAPMLAEPGTEAVTIDHTVWVRRERVVSEQAPEFDEEVTSRRIEYRTAVPGHPRTWVLALGTATGDGDPDSDATVLCMELIDAIMLNWRWRRDDFEPAAD